MTNSVDSDQLAALLQKSADLDLHCLQKQGISRFSRMRVKQGFEVSIHNIYPKYLDTYSLLS